MALIDNNSLAAISKLELDYIPGLSKSGFVFKNSDLKQNFHCKMKFSG
jgi:Fe-S cluster assembly iron-binding protein IscA